MSASDMHRDDADGAKPTFFIATISHTAVQQHCCVPGTIKSSRGLVLQAAIIILLPNVILTSFTLDGCPAAVQ